ARRQMRADGGDMLGARGGEQQRLGQRQRLFDVFSSWRPARQRKRDPARFGIEYQRANRPGKRRATRFARQPDLAPALTQMLDESLGLGGFARALDAFQR